MYLSKLELHGFKSFADRTALTFDPGITAVVGPNGCGKSNIVDAVRWVIGEQRARVLRSDKMENVIFNGTAKKRPLGMAEVRLTIENTRGVLPVEYSEVTIGRRLFRSGESEYLLNGVQCRLKDVTDLFMDTGMGAGAYSVIELKMIEEILSDNEHDRRRLFEEAAGITRYKMRRSQALRKLKNTQSDLTRLRDLLDEIEKRVRSLKRQASRAAQYKDVDTRLRTLELSLARVEFDRLSEQERDIKSQLQGLQDLLEGEVAQHGESEAALEALRVALIEREGAFNDSQAALMRHQEEVRGIEADLRLYRERVDNANSDLVRTRREQEEARERITALDTHVEELEAERQKAAPLVIEAVSQLETAGRERDDAHRVATTARNALSDLRRDEQVVADSASDTLRMLDRLTSRLELLQQDRELSDSQRVQLSAETEDAAKAVEQARELLDQRRAATAEANERLARAIGNRTSRTQELEALQDALREIERRYEATTAEVQLLESLVSSYDDFSVSVQFLASDDGWSNGPLTTVGDLFACDDAVKPAVMSALLPYEDCIVVASEQEARSALSRLASTDNGRATFIVLDRLPNNIPFAEPPTPNASPLGSFVRCDPAHERLARLLLLNCFLVDSIHDVEMPAVGADHAKFFDRTGAWRSATGFVHGGASSGRGSGGRLGRREQLQQATQLRERLGYILKERTDRVRQARAALESVHVEETRSFVAEREREEVDAEKLYARARFEHTGLARRNDELTERIAHLASSIEQALAESARLQERTERDQHALAEARAKREKGEDAFHRAEAANRASLARFSEFNVRAVEARNHLETIERDLARSREDLEDLGRRTRERDAYVEHLNEQIAQSRKSIESLSVTLRETQEKRPALEQHASDAANLMAACRAEISDLETHLRELRRTKEEKLRAENQQAVKLAEVHTRIEDLVRHIEEDYNIAVLDIEVDAEAVENEADARKEVVDLRRRVRAMGPINELALEEYEEENQRLEFMSEQYNDLTEAEATLLRTIDEINTTASKRFMETFEAIRANFTNLFSELFGSDTTADVILEIPSDPLESGIEVIARPRGKRPSTLAQLSGGEKTLTAIALLFAIYLVKPSPFCILDEVDAPLDDANILRFMRLIRDFSRTTQFILVTHNKRTMEAADRMYGVTMQEHGVSNLVGVKFEEAQDLAQA